MPLSGETSPTDPVFSLDVAKRLKPEAKGVYDNVPDVQGRKVDNRHKSMSGEFPKSVSKEYSPLSSIFVFSNFLCFSLF